MEIGAADEHHRVLGDVQRRPAQAPHRRRRRFAGKVVAMGRTIDHDEFFRVMRLGIGRLRQPARQIIIHVAHAGGHAGADTADLNPREAMQREERQIAGRRGNVAAHENQVEIGGAQRPDASDQLRRQGHEGVRVAGAEVLDRVVGLPHRVQQDLEPRPIEMTVDRQGREGFGARRIIGHQNADPQPAAIRSRTERMVDRIVQHIERGFHDRRALAEDVAQVAVVAI
ncbi:MAG: hypothetical protein WDO24_17210 [Pseudomonadota bacterium]